MKSYENFYYGEIREAAKTNAVGLISAQFEKMRENMQWSNSPVDDSCNNEKATSNKQKVVSPSLKRNPLESDVGTPFVLSSDRSVQSSASSVRKKHPSVPSHIVPKSPSRNQRLKVQSNIISSYNSSDVNFTEDLLRSAAGSCNKFSDDREAYMQYEELSLSYTGSAEKQQSRTANPHVSLPERPTLLRTLGGSAISLTTVGSDKQCVSPSMHTFRGKRNVSAEQLRQDLVLHHDIFLAGRDEDVVEAVSSISRRRHWAVPRYPQSTDAVQIDYSLRPDVKNTPRTVPSRVVQPRETVPLEQRRQRAEVSVMRPLCPSRSRSLSPTARRNSPRSHSVPTTARLGAFAALEETATVVDATVEVTALTSQSVSSSPGTSIGLNQAQAGSGNRAQLSRRDTGVFLPASLCTQAVVKATTAERELSPVTVTDRLSPVTVPAAVGTAVAKTKTSAGGTSSIPAKAAKGKVLVSPPTTTSKSASARPTTSVTKQQQTLHSGKDRKAVPYTRPLTAAEHAGAHALSTKLTAANLAWHREATAGANVLPRRQVSRALSQLVYCVRPDEK